MNDKLKVGVVGVGRWGRSILRVLSELKDLVNVIAICDINQVNLSEVAKRFEVKSKYTSIDDMLSNESLDAIFIAVTPENLTPISLKALKDNIHIFVEKPVACSYKDALKLYEESRKRSVVVVPGFIMRFNPVVNAIKELIEKCGKPYTIDFRRLSKRPPSLKQTHVLLDLGIHDIDLMFYLLNCDNIRVSCVHRYSSINGESYNISLECDEVSVFLRVDELSPIKIREIDIVGANYYIRGDTVNNKLLYLIQGKVFEKFITGEEPLKLEIIEFIKAVEGKESSSPSLCDALKALKVVDEILSQC